MTYFRLYLAFICLIFIIMLTLDGCATSQAISQSTIEMPIVQCIFPTKVSCALDLSDEVCNQVAEASTWWNRQLFTPKPFFVYTGHDICFGPECVIITQIPGGWHHFDGFHNGPQTTMESLIYNRLTNLKDPCRVMGVIQILLDPKDLTPASFQTILRHELGHILGLPDLHSKEDCVMNGVHFADLEMPANTLCDEELVLLWHAYRTKSIWEFYP